MDMLPMMFPHKHSPISHRAAVRSGANSTHITMESFLIASAIRLGGHYHFCSALYGSSPASSRTVTATTFRRARCSENLSAPRFNSMSHRLITDRYQARDGWAAAAQKRIMLWSRWSKVWLPVPRLQRNRGELARSALVSLPWFYTSE